MAEPRVTRFGAPDPEAPDPVAPDRGAPDRGVAALPRTLRRAQELVAAGLMTQEAAAGLEPVFDRYDVAVTPEMAGLIDPADPHDPIARQFLPDPRELARTAEERDDPIGDAAHSPCKGIVHRYPDRVLLTPMHACAVYCRFCFRRERVGTGGAALNEVELDEALDYVRANPAIWEVIVTGGDPFLLSPARLNVLLKALDAIPHVQVIRFHTRVPLVDPERVGQALLDALAVDTAVYVAIHANHPRELSPAARSALRRLSSAGVPLLAQTVLLRGLNDDAIVLEELFRLLVANRVKPYYLHHGDLAPGTGHWRTGLDAGQALTASLRGRVSGLCQPTYVLDLPGGAGKVPVGPTYATRTGEGWQVEDYRGGSHEYPTAFKPAS